MADNETFTFESAKEFFKDESWADRLTRMPNKELMALEEALYKGKQYGEGDLGDMRDLVNGEETDRLKRYAKLDSYAPEELEDILALANRYNAEQGNYVEFAKEIINKINAQKKSLEDQQQKLQDNQNNNEQAVQPSQDGDQGGDQGEGSETDGNEDAVKKAEQALDDYVFEKYKWSKYIQYNDYEEMPTIVKEGDYEAFYNDFAKNNPEDEDYKKLMEALEAARGNKPQQQENSEVKTYTAEELKTLMHNQTNALYNREGLGAAEFAKFHEEGKKILEAFVKGEVNVDSSAYTEMSGFINVFAGEYGDNNDEMKKLYDDATNKLESIKAEAENKNDQENEANDQENEANESTPQAESKPVENNEQSDSDQGEDSGTDETQETDNQKQILSAEELLEIIQDKNTEKAQQVVKDFMDDKYNMDLDALGVMRKVIDNFKDDETIGGLSNKALEKLRGLELENRSEFKVGERTFAQVRDFREYLKKPNEDETVNKFNAEQLKKIDQQIVASVKNYNDGLLFVKEAGDLYIFQEILQDIKVENDEDKKAIEKAQETLKNDIAAFEEYYGIDNKLQPAEVVKKNYEQLDSLPNDRSLLNARDVPEYKLPEKVSFKEYEGKITDENIGNLSIDDLVGCLRSEGITSETYNKVLTALAEKISREDIPDVFAMEKEGMSKDQIATKIAIFDEALKRISLLPDVKDKYEELSDESTKAKQSLEYNCPFKNEELRNVDAVLNRLNFVSEIDEALKNPKLTADEKKKLEDKKTIENQEKLSLFKEQVRKETMMYLANTTKEGQVTEKAFVEEYINRLQLATLRLTQTEEVVNSVETMRKNKDNKDFKADFFKIFGEKDKKIDISEATFAAHMQASLDRMNDANIRLAGKSGYKKVSNQYSADIKSLVDKNNKSEAPSTGKMVRRALLKSLGVGALCATASMVCPPISSAMVSGYFLIKSSIGMYKDIKKKREEYRNTVEQVNEALNKYVESQYIKQHNNLPITDEIRNSEEFQRWVQGYEHREINDKVYKDIKSRLPKEPVTVWNYIKQNPIRVLSTGLTAVSAAMGIAGAAEYIQSVSQSLEVGESVIGTMASQSWEHIKDLGSNIWNNLTGQGASLSEMWKGATNLGADNLGADKPAFADLALSAKVQKLTGWARYFTMGASVADAVRKAPEGQKWKTFWVSSAGMLGGFLGGRMLGVAATDHQQVNNVTPEQVEIPGAKPYEEAMEMNNENVHVFGENFKTVTPEMTDGAFRHGGGLLTDLLNKELDTNYSIKGLYEAYQNGELSAEEQGVLLKFTQEYITEEGKPTAEAVEIFNDHTKHMASIHNRLFHNNNMEVKHIPPVSAGEAWNKNYVDPSDRPVDLDMDGKPDTVVKIVNGKPVVSYLNENTGKVEVIKEGSTVRVDIDGSGKTDPYEVYAKEGYTTEVNHNDNGDKVIRITQTNMETGEKDVTIVSPKGVFVDHYDQKGNLISRGEMVGGKEVKSLEATYDDDGNCTKYTRYEDGKVSSTTEHVYDKHRATHIIDNDGDGKADITRTHLYNKGVPYATIETKDNITNISMDERYITIDEKEGVITVTEKGENGDRVSYEATKEGLKDGKWEDLVEKITKKPEMDLKDKYFHEVDNKVETLAHKSAEGVLTRQSYVEVVNLNNLTDDLPYIDHQNGTYSAFDGTSFTDEQLMRNYVTGKIVEIAKNDSTYLELIGKDSLTPTELQFVEKHEEDLDNFGLYHDKHNNLLNELSDDKPVLSSDGDRIIENPQRIQHGIIYGVNDEGSLEIRESSRQPEGFDVKQAVYDDIKTRLNDGDELSPAEEKFMEKYEAKDNSDSAKKTEVPGNGDEVKKEDVVELEEADHTTHKFEINYNTADDRAFQNTLKDGLEVYRDPETGKWCLGKEGCEPIAEANDDRGGARLNNLKISYAAQAGADEARYQNFLAQGEENLDPEAKQWMAKHDEEMAQKWGLTRVDGKLYNPEQLNELRITNNYGSVLHSKLISDKGEVEVPEAFTNTEHELTKVDDKLTICWDKENGWSVRGHPNETGDNKDLNNDPIVKAYNAIQNKEDNGTQLTSFEKEFIKYAEGRFQKLGISFDDNHKVVIANNEKLGVPYKSTSMMANPLLNGAEDLTITPTDPLDETSEVGDGAEGSGDITNVQTEERLKRKSAEDVFEEMLENNRKTDMKNNMEKIRTQLQELQNGKNPNLSTDTSATVAETEQSTTHSSSSNDGLETKGAGLKPGLKTDNDASNNGSRGKAETGTNLNKTNSGQMPYYSKNNSNYR